MSKPFSKRPTAPKQVLAKHPRTQARYRERSKTKMRAPNGRTVVVTDNGTSAVHPVETKKAQGFVVVE